MDALEVRELSNDRPPRVGHRANRAMTPSVVPGSRTALVVAAMGGDDVAFTRLAQADAADAYRVAYVLLGSSADAQEVTQEALLRAWLQLPGLRDPERWPAWFRRIVVNAARDRLRSTRRRAELPLFDMAAADAHELLTTAAADRDQLRRAIAHLSGDEQTVIALHYGADLTLLDVAEALRIPVGTVRSRLDRALEQLRRHSGDLR